MAVDRGRGGAAAERRETCGSAVADGGGGRRGHAIWNVSFFFFFIFFSFPFLIIMIIFKRLYHRFFMYVNAIRIFKATRGYWFFFFLVTKNYNNTFFSSSHRIRTKLQLLDTFPCPSRVCTPSPTTTPAHDLIVCCYNSLVDSTLMLRTTSILDIPTYHYEVCILRVIITSNDYIMCYTI